MTALRDSAWWIVRDWDDPDMQRLLETIGGTDWAVFSNGKQDVNAAPPVALAVARTTDGRLVCKGLLVGLNEAYPVGNRRYGEPVEVTSRDLRAIPIAELIGQAVHAAPQRHSGFARMATSRSTELSKVRRKPGPKGHPDEHFQMVAAQYRRALDERPNAPVVWLTKELGVDRSTVSRWVQRARDKGYLGEAAPGRAGERAEGNDQ